MIDNRNTNKLNVYKLCEYDFKNNSFKQIRKLFDSKNVFYGIILYYMTFISNVFIAVIVRDT